MQLCKSHKTGKRHWPYSRFGYRHVSFAAYECLPIKIHTPNGVRLSGIQIGRRCSNFKRSDCRVQIVWDSIYRLGRRTVTDWRDVEFWERAAFAYKFRPQGSQVKCSWCSDRMRTCKAGRLHKNVCRRSHLVVHSSSESSVHVDAKDRHAHG